MFKIDKKWRFDCLQWIKLGLFNGLIKIRLLKKKNKKRKGFDRFWL